MEKVVAINGPSLVGGLNWVHLLRPLGYSVVAGPVRRLRQACKAATAHQKKHRHWEIHFLLMGMVAPRSEPYSLHRSV
jgi:hypothetical protein